MINYPKLFKDIDVRKTLIITVTSNRKFHVSKKYYPGISTGLFVNDRREVFELMSKFQEVQFIRHSDCADVTDHQITLMVSWIISYLWDAEKKKRMVQDLLKRIQVEGSDKVFEPLGPFVLRKKLPKNWTTI